MNRLESVLQERRRAGRKSLALFLTDGYPGIGDTPGLIGTLVEGGADIIEIGMPFSDPLADGPVIQESSTAALANGVTLATVLAHVRAVRQASAVPLVLMGYLNPILRYGAERFAADAAAAGADGLILPELPVEESHRFRETLAAAGLAQILLVTPTTPPERIEAIDRAATGFVYCVSSTGVTGGTRHSPEGYLQEVRQRVRCNPLLVGFGIATPADAARTARAADGVIIGSALIRKLRDGCRGQSLRSWVGGIREALDTAR